MRIAMTLDVKQGFVEYLPQFALRVLRELGNQKESGRNASLEMDFGDRADPRQTQLQAFAVITDAVMVEPSAVGFAPELPPWVNALCVVRHDEIWHSVDNANSGRCPRQLQISCAAIPVDAFFGGEYFFLTFDVFEEGSIR